MSCHVHVTSCHVHVMLCYSVRAVEPYRASHVMSCHVMSCHVMSCHVMSCYSVRAVEPYRACSYVMSCHVMSCHSVRAVEPYRASRAHPCRSPAPPAARTVYSTRTVQRTHTYTHTYNVAHTHRVRHTHNAPPSARFVWTLCVSRVLLPRQCSAARHGKSRQVKSSVPLPRQCSAARPTPRAPGARLRPRRRAACSTARADPAARRGLSPIRNQFRRWRTRTPRHGVHT
jgi:hypothetical protein